MVPLEMMGGGEEEAKEGETDALRPAGRAAGAGLLSESGLQMAQLRRIVRLQWLFTVVLGSLLCAFTAFVWLSVAGRGGTGLECTWGSTGGNRSGAFQPTATAPRVLLISFDGFRFDYVQRAQVAAPNFRRLIREGTRAERLIPVYPSKTFPNHYSLATGLYPTSHGIIANSFCYRDWRPCFSMANKEPRYWLGQPIWQTVALQGRRATTYFWPGSEVPKPGWPCSDAETCAPYREETPYEERVAATLRKFEGVAEEWPDLSTLYFELADETGHSWGTECPEMTEAVERLDGVVGQLLEGLEERGALEQLHVVVVGDHGMVSLCGDRQVDLAKLAPWLDPSWVKALSPQLGIEPPPGHDLDALLADLRAALAGSRVQISRREELPARLHYSAGAASDRVWPIYGFPAEGYRIVMGGGGGGCGGNHGYDNRLESMGTVFLGRGPRFHRGKTVPPFEAVEVYNVLAEIIGVEPAPNNGTEGFARELLKAR